MKISLQWLNDYVDVKEFFAAPEKLAAKLTAAGLEVESVTDLGKQFGNVVLGKIIELAKHPNADRLTVCQVDAGEGKLRQIVCGAKNHKQGDHVVVALPGAILPGDFAIKDSKIRDVESKGMLCSESELGLKKDAEGILILPQGSPVGVPFADYSGLKDIVLEINVTPNRADCLSHIGLAREIACLLDRKIRMPKAAIKGGAALTKKTISVKLKDAQQCPRYAGRVIKGVKVGPSPAWLQQRLKAVDINSINNVVDITNYVMLELGQPLHAFDIRFLKGNQIVIDKANAGETFTSFDGTEFKLKGDELTIRDGERPVALAGIVGGKNSGVQDDTETVFIESAHFAAESVRRTSRKLGIQTDSAYRFTRGTDPEGVVLAMNRACELLLEHASGEGIEVASDHYDEYPKPIVRKPIPVSTDYVSERLGYEVNDKEFTAWMKRLGCEVKANGKKLQVTAPDYRWDLFDKTDLVEEFGRLKGYDAIPETFPKLEARPLAHESQYVLENMAIDQAKELGFHQAINYGFVSSKFQAELLGPVAAYEAGGLRITGEPVRLKNPLNEELDVMRSSLLPWLFKNALQNYRYGNEAGRLFEVGAVFSKGQDGYSQSTRISFAAWGQHEGLWQKGIERPVVYDLKASLEGLLEKLGIGNYQWQSAKTIPALFHPAQAAALFCEGRLVGWIGSVHPERLETEKIRVGVAMTELDFEKLMRGQPRLPKSQPLSKFPAVQRDIALVMPESMLAGDVIREIKKTAGPLLREVSVFDVFMGGNLPAGQKSVAFRLLLQDANGTLTDAQIQGVQSQIIKGVSEKLKLQVRA